MALNLNDYEKTPWEPKMPITKDRMDKLEEGVYVNREALQSLDNSVTTIDNSISAINSGLEARPTTTQVQALVQQGAGQGAWARTEIITAMEGDTYTSLKNRFDTDENAIADIKATLGTKNVEGSDKPVDAFSSTNTVYNAINAVTVSAGLIIDEVRSARTDSIKNNTYDSLSLHLRNIDSNIDIMQSNIANINAAAGENTTIAGRFAQLDALREEVAAAHRAVETGEEPDTLAKRFSAIDTAINDILTDVNTVKNAYVPRELVRDNFTSEDTDLPLSAKKGKELRDMIGGAYNSENTVASAINTAERNAKNYADANKVDKANIYNALDYVPAQDATDDKVLDARQGKALKDTIDALNTSLDARLDAIELELNNARIELSTDEESGDPLMSTLDQRLDAMDATAAALRNEVQVIANELAMYDDNDAIQDTWTRVDKLSRDVEALAAELSMARNENGELIDAASRIDNLEYTISHVSSDEDSTVGLTQRIAALESDVDTAENNISDLDTRLDAIDGNTAGTLINRVSAAESAITSLQREPKSATVIEPALPDTGDPNKDYLIGPNEDGKYFYYKWISNEWQLISGGGSGSGNSSGEFAVSLESITEPDINTDYFVGNNTNGYLHYRYIEQENSEELEPVLIGVSPDNIKRYNIERVLGKKREYNSETQQWEETDEDVYYLNLYEFDYGASNAQSNIEESMVPIGQIELPQGGGGGSTISTTPRVVRITPSTITTVQNDEHIYLRFFYAAVDATGESFDSTYTLKYNNSSIISSGTLNSGAYDQTVTTGVWPAAPRPVGFYEIDVTEYCRLGSQTFNLVVTVNGQDIPRVWTVNILELRLESSAPQSQLIEVGNTIQFPYTPYGAMTKTLYVRVDGNVVKTQSLGAGISGSELEVTIPSQAHGAHTISVNLEASLDGATIPTLPISRDYIWYDVNNTSEPIIIASPYRDTPIEVEQYAELQIPYTIYNKNAATSTVKYYVGEDLIDTVNISNSGTFSYVFEDFGEKEVHITVDDVSLDFDVTVTEIKADVAQVTGAVINFDPSTLTNTSANRLPTWTYNNETYHMTVSDNFNWSNDASGGGYKEDIDGKCFVVKAGTYAYFDYKMFKMAVNNSDPENPIYTSSVFDKGAEMKVIFKVSAVRDASAVWFTNIGNPSSSNQMPIGIQLSAHQGWLKTSAADAAEKQAQREGTTASTNSYLYFPYSEEDKIELDININKTGNREDFIMSYEDGVPSKAYAYETTEILYHEPGNESIIRIGSPDCDVYIYKFRVYDKGLGTSDILRNFIADGKTVTDKVNRYNRNSIYYDSTKPEGQQFTPYKTGSAVLDPEKLAEKMPDVKILMLEADTFTKDKNTFVNSSLRCIHADGGTVYPSRGDEDNWLFRNGLHSGQGTTSDNYGQSSRNVDFLFMCDGTHAPTKKKNITNDQISLVSELIKGKDKSVLNPTTKSWTPTVDAVVETCSDWKGDDAKVSLTSTSIPNNYFNLKVNVASSENVNNALFQKRYNDFLRYVYESPAYKRDNRIKNDMEFVPAILFIRETNPTKDENNNYTSHLEFNDTDWHFYSLGNIGDSKKTDYTRAYDPTDMNEFTVEISDNNTSNSQFQSGVYISNNERIIEESDSGINPTNYIWDINMDTEWNAMRDPTEREIEHDERVAAKQTKYSDGTDVENAKTTYILPNGKVYVNYRHRMLSGDPFDGKHSFEFRYACKGDYRDGDLINDTNGKIEVNGSQVSRDEHQFSINRQVVEAFYTWVVTSSNEEFKQHLSEWCVPEAVEFFYAFTHFYTMMDNRAKNCFWHFGKTGTHRQVHTPYKELLHVYDELKDGSYEPTEDTEIDPNKTYYTEYAFDLWAYDMDTAAGIDNNGELVFPYGKEDTDYRQAGVSSSGYVFNGAGSIIWRRLSTSFTDEIADIFNRVNEAACFDAMNLINQFDTFQNCYPEEMWRLDIERKYIRTFTGKVYDNCKLEDASGNTKQNTRFLKEMMQGRKKYQRRQWVRDQAIYFGSKYMLNNIRNNTIEMVCYTPDAPLWNSQGYEYKENDITYYRPFVAGDFTFYGSENNRKLYKCIEGNADSTFIASKWAESVTPDYKLKLVPYQDMYLNVAVGTGNLRVPVRAVAGQEYTIDCTANMNETRVYIYAGSYIQAISGLAPFYIGANIFSSAARLKKLDLGTDNPNYHNTNLKTLTILPHMPILEELNVKNCDSLNTPINLSESNNLKIVEAEGSTIPSLSLPAYTAIETLHLPSTVNTLILQSARKLTSFYMKNKETGLEDYSSLINMNISDSDYSGNINWMDIASSALQHLNSLYLRDLNKASVHDINDLDSFVSRKMDLETQYDEQGNLINKINLSGVLNVLGTWSSIEIANYQLIWPNLSFNTQPEKETIKYKLSFYLNTEDALNNARPYYTIYLPVEEGMTDAQLGEDPVYIGLCETPTKASTISKEYYFGTNPTTYYSWSGWRIVDNASVPRAGMTINSNTVFVAVFGEKTRTYPLRWYLNETDNEDDYVKQVLGLEYNSSYENGLAPTALDMIQANKTLSSLNGTNYTYKIFKGWAREPINLDSTYFNTSQTAFCIYGSWEQGTESLATIRAQEELDEKKLLVLTNTNDKILPTSSTYTVEMGYDNNSGTTIIGKNATLGISPRGEAYTGEDVNHPVLKFTQYNGALAPTIRPVNDIKPFAKMNTDGFTLVIDYQLDTDYLRSIYSNGYCILGGCYAANSGDNTAQGFAIYYDINAGVVKACFGNLANTNTYSSSDYSCAISNSYGSSKRNIVVIRHMKGTNTLQFYSGIHGEQGMLLNLNNDNFRQTLTWSNNNITSPLCFGHFTNGTFTALASVHPGVGTTIHWAKYWETDLGHNECTLLAAWPHEKITFALSDYSNDGTNDILVTNSKNMIFSALQLSEYGGAYYDPINIATNNTVNWGTGLTTNTNSAYKKISNQRFFLGLPIKLQSIITRTVGNAATITAASTGYYPVYQYTTSGETIDLAFIPTYIEVGGTDINYQSEALRAFPWYTGSNAQVFSYGTNNFLFDDVSYSAEYMNLRFSSIPIKTTSGINNVFVGYSGTDPVYNKINNISSNPNGGIRRGDIFVYTYTSNNNTITNTYIYADGLDVAQGAPIVNAAEGELLYCDVGGWIKAGSWWTRTPAATYENRATGSQPFFYIDGNTSSIRYNSTPAEGGAYFVYEFGI